MKKFTLIVLLFSMCIMAKEKQNKINEGSSINPKNFDYSVKPGDDFYQFAIGNWLKENPIPADHSSWGAFDVLLEENNLLVKAIVDDILNGKLENSKNFTKLAILFSSGMDTTKIEKEGYKPILPYLQRIDKIKNLTDFVKETAFSHLYISAPLFSFGSEQDQKNSDWVIIGLSQGGLGLPERDYYVADDPDTKEAQDLYKKHVKNMFMLIDIKEAEAENISESIFNFEKKLAEVSFTNVELRDPQANYNKMTADELNKISANFDWKLFLKECGVSKTDEINVGQVKFFTKLSEILKSTEINTLKNYLKWNLLRSSASYLSSAFVNEKFEFYSKYLYGAQVLQPRWKRVLGVANNQVGEILGQVYVDKYFPKIAKEKAETVVKNLLKAMEIRLNNLTWMTPETKVKALKKLKAFNYKIGYPDKWKNFDDLNFSNLSYYQNVVEASYFNSRDDLNKIGKKVDKSEWEILPQTVNAYYHPVLNEVVFPAAILQPPFFDYKADDAVNYGAIGAVIGHEITHGFDDQGRQYDFDGNMRDWWTKADEEMFNERTVKLIDQFNKTVIIDTLTINGELTLGENIADLGGLTISYEAFKNSPEFNQDIKLDGFTPKQRFFLSWAQVWKSNDRDEFLKLLIKTDVHSPAKARVNNPLSNLPMFYETFEIKEGDKMFKPANERIVIW
ncbi:MAG TPA: M13 family metallopeptidase [Melioribacteraceae bacterium]|nr:M13 family metallopeptidase [Melioribacteraceae bacterium]